MGFFSKAWKSVKKHVKKVAKAVKTVGSKVWGGIKKGVAKIGEAFGKLGPLGTIALSFVMPGIGSMLSGMWSSAASSLIGSSSGFLSAVGQGMQTAANLASKAGSFLSDAASPITSKIKSGLEFVGGKVADGANAIVKGAQEFMGVKNPASISDMGKWVTDKAKSFVEKPSTTDLSAMNNSELTAEALKNNPEFAKMANFSSTQASPVSAQDLIKKQASFLGERATDAAAFTAEANPELVKMANFEGTTVGDLATQQTGALQQNAGLKALSGGETSQSTGLLEKVAKAAAQSFGAQQAQAVMPQFSTGDVPDITASTRFGIGGQGAAGGTFLSDAQRQQQSIMAQILGQIG